MAIGHRIAILHDGRVVQTGRPAEIILSPATDYVRRFTANVNRARALRVADVMELPRPGVNGGSTKYSTTLEQALPLALGAPDGLHVEDEQGNRVGYLRRARLVSTIIAAEDG